MKKIYIINGTARSGKNTFVNYAEDSFKLLTGLYTYDISSVDPVKEAAKLLGWDEVKDETGRKFLSDLKDLSTAMYNGPLKYMISKIEEYKEGFLFFHIREPEEIQKLKNIYPEIKTILLKRSNLEQYSNHADMNVENYDYDFVFDNSGSLFNLSDIVWEFAKSELNIDLPEK